MRIAVVLALPLEYNTSAMLRCKSIINALGANGHEVKCYAPTPDINHKYYSPSHFDNNVRVFRYAENRQTFNAEQMADHTKNKSFKSRVKAFAYRIFKKVDVFGSSLLYLSYRKIISADIKNEKFDLMISFSDPMPAHMIANYCKKKNKKLKYVQQWGDPLAADTISKTALPVWMRKKIEKRMIRRADKVCYVSPFTCEEQKVLFQKFSDKFVFLPTPSIQYENVSETIQNKGKLSLGYFGSYNSVARNIMPFYNAACQCKNIDTYIIGDSDVSLESNDHVFVIKRMNQNELKQYFGKIDVVVCLMNSKGNQIPGKLYHDGSTTKDILLIKDGEYGDRIEKFFSKYHHYTFVENDETAILKALDTYVKSGVPIREPIKEFEPSVIAEELIKLS